MRYLSVCSGIEAATVAWHPLGWTPSAFSEVDGFASALLSHYYPAVPNLGDMTAFRSWPNANLDVLVGGTPCQSFSVAGLRGGLDDPRGNLLLTYLAIAERFRPRWLVWENVPGVLSADGGRAFGALLGGLGQLGYGFAYRVLDAQFFGVPQRRRRVFVVGCLGDWRRAAAVLFESHCLQGHPPPRREAGQGVAGSLTSGAANGSAAHGARSGSAKETNLIDCPDIVPQAMSSKWAKGSSGPAGDEVANLIASAVAPTLPAGGNATGGHRQPGMQVDTARAGETGSGDSAPCVALDQAVRRLTPRECERLQGFPDDYTLVPYRGKPSADGPRYKALGNSMAVPVMRWIGERIALVDEIP